MEIYEKQLDNRASGDVPCYSEMAICLCKQGRPGEAEAILQAALDSGGNNPEWLYMLYEIQRSSGNFKGASRTLKRLRKNAGVTVFNDEYGELSIRLLMEEGRLAIAGKLAESLSSYDGEQLCAILYVLRGSYRSAMRLLRKLIERGAGEYRALQLDGALSGSLGQAERSRGLCKDGAQGFCRHPRFGGKAGVAPTICVSTRSCCISRGRRSRPYEIFERAASAVPCHDEICSRCYEAYYGIGLCKAFDGERQAAQEAFAESCRSSAIIWCAGSFRKIL